MRVLIAEDDPASRRILESLLTKLGYNIVSTCDGNEAWEQMKAPDAPRLAILDWMMPGMDGVEVCRRIRQMDTRNPVYIILLTALNSKKDIVRGLEAGANDYVTKPYDSNKLRARIQVGRQVVDLQSALTNQIRELQEALSLIKTLQGIIPICMHCHKIRNNQETWQKMEKYVEEHSEAQFSHSICPECMEKHYPEQEQTEVH